MFWRVLTWSAVIRTSYLDQYEQSMGRWYRSKDRVQGPFQESSSYMMNKKWWLEEQFTLHMMRFQQVKSVYQLNNLTYTILGWVADQRSWIQRRGSDGAT